MKEWDDGIVVYFAARKLEPLTWKISSTIRSTQAADRHDKLFQHY